MPSIRHPPRSPGCQVQGTEGNGGDAPARLLRDPPQPHPNRPFVRGRGKKGEGPPVGGPRRCPGGPIGVHGGYCSASIQLAQQQAGSLCGDGHATRWQADLTPVAIPLHGVRDPASVRGDRHGVLCGKGTELQKVLKRHLAAQSSVPPRLSHSRDGGADPPHEDRLPFLARRHRVARRGGPDRTPGEAWATGPRRRLLPEGSTRMPGFLPDAAMVQGGPVARRTHAGTVPGPTAPGRCRPVWPPAGGDTPAPVAYRRDPATEDGPARAPRCRPFTPQARW